MKDKNPYPFFLGTTSYIIPDDILPNARFLAPFVDDIELVLFESPNASNFPSADTIRELAELREKYSISYTVHLPADNKAGAPGPKERTRFCDAAMKTIERCMPLFPAAWIMHCEGINATAIESEITDWTIRCQDMLEKIRPLLHDPSTIAIENLGYPWHLHSALALKNGTSLCCDIGHLWLYFPDCWREHFRAMLPKTRVIHLHGVRGNKDHLSLASSEKSRLDEFFQILDQSRYYGIVTLEIFSEKDFYESMEIVQKIFTQRYQEAKNIDKVNYHGHPRR